MWSFRTLFPYVAAAGLLGAVAWATSFGTLPPADFAFGNGTEIKSVDPHIVTGVPEHRIIDGIFEGLYKVDPKTVQPIPGVAERHELSADGRVYTFHFRENAKWSDGTPVTAEDFVWSWRRFLHPETGAEYAYQGWYIRGAEEYTSATVQAGNAVEIEMPDRRVPNQLFPRGTILHGTLVEITDPNTKTQPRGTPILPIAYVVDVNGTLRRFCKEEQPGCERCLQILPDFEATVGVRAIDARTLEVTLKNATPYFLDLTTMYCLYPVHRGCVERHGFPDWTKPENIITNGPYRLEMRRIRDRVRMVKSPDYWDAANVALNTIDALAIQSDTTMLNMYLDGQLDWATNVPLPAIPVLQKREDFWTFANLAVYFYRINTTREPFNDVRVRRALNLAMDKREIVERVLKAGQIPARSLVPPGLEGYESALGGDYDPEKARQLLAEAGYPGGQGFPMFEILYNTNEGHQRVAEVVQRQWQRNLGIDVRLANQEWAVFLDACKQLQHHVARAGWNGDYPDANTFLDMFVTNGANNQTGWSNARYDGLIAAAAAEGDAKKRLRILHDAEAVLVDEMPIIPMYFYVRLNMVRPYVEGFFNNILDEHPLTDLRIDQQKKREYWQNHSR